jgi:hypothetical protein
MRPEILRFLQQDHTATVPIDQTLAGLEQLAVRLDQPAPAQNLLVKKLK